MKIHSRDERYVVRASKDTAKLEGRIFRELFLKHFGYKPRNIEYLSDDSNAGFDLDASKDYLHALDINKARELADALNSQRECIFMEKIQRVIESCCFSPDDTKKLESLEKMKSVYQPTLDKAMKKLFYHVETIQEPDLEFIACKSFENFYDILNQRCNSCKDTWPLGLIVELGFPMAFRKGDRIISDFLTLTPGSRIAFQDYIEFNLRSDSIFFQIVSRVAADPHIRLCDTVDNVAGGEYKQLIIRGENNRLIFDPTPCEIWQDDDRYVWLRYSDRTTFVRLKNQPDDKDKIQLTPPFTHQVLAGDNYLDTIGIYGAFMSNLGNEKGKRYLSTIADKLKVISQHFDGLANLDID